MPVSHRAARLVTAVAALFAALVLGAPALPAGTGPQPARSASPAPEGAPEPSAADIEFFEKSVRPVLAQHCYGCHSTGSKPPKGGLKLDSRAALLKGGDLGAAVVPGHPERSRLVKAVSYAERGLQMPPKGKLPDEKVAALTEWVRRGAPWPGPARGPKSKVEGPKSTVQSPKSKVQGRGPSDPGLGTRDPGLSHWAFQPLKRPALPVVKDRTWPQTAVDSFILAKLDSARLQPAKPADRRTLIRRVTYDLTGLPPTPAEIDAFLSDKSPDAYKKVVERLLASPHYGERWARHWLDLVRFAETDGHEFDFEKPDAWRYRDYVIRAFNEDVPYNQIVLEHVAGDLLPRPRLNPADRSSESLIGTGFWWFGEGKHSPVDIREDEAERVDNQIDVFSKTFLGLSVGCARCHDHKFDPIPTKDYYALYGYLRSSRYQLAAIDAPEAVTERARNLGILNEAMVPLVLQRAAAAQQRQIEQIPALLVAGTDPAGARLAAVGQEQADAGTVDRWTRYLAEKASRRVLDPLHPWTALGGARTPETFAAARAALLTRLRAEADRSRRARDAAVLFEDFSRQSYGDWFVSGEAFGSEPLRDTGVRLAADGAVETVAAPGTADSGRLSDRLQGVLRSQTFTITKPRIFYRMAGRDAQVNLIIDGFQRIRFPIYGGLTIAVKDGGPPAWYVQDVAKWAGHRAYIEVVDQGSGYIVVDEIRFGEGAAPAAAPNALVVGMVGDARVTSREALARGYGELLRSAVQALRSGTLSRDGADLINWMLRSGLSGTGSGGPDAALAGLLEKRRSVESAIQPPRRVMAMADGTPEDEPVHIRGSHKQLGELVPRRFLQAIAGKEQAAPAQGSGRLELARRMIGSGNPLLPRVLVNRIWQHHFGEGLVRTPDDFGVRGERPTHPELLDYLAGRFAGVPDTGSRVPGRKSRSHENDSGPGTLHSGLGTGLGWRIKALHRMIVLSAAYQMSSRAAPVSEARDPQNRLLHRMPVRRLEGEAIRDAVLAVSGRLDRKLYGPSVLPHLTPFMEGRGRPSVSGSLDGNGRRSLYISVRRNFLTPMFLAFDYPIPFTTIGKRSVSTVPAQALTLMNNPFVVEQAGVWAKRVLEAPGMSPRERIGGMYVTAFARPPSEAEVSAALAFLEEQDRRYGAPGDPRSWSDLCHVLMNTKEFIFLE
jgi:hypothetical protein